MHMSRCNDSQSDHWAYFVHFYVTNLLFVMTHNLRHPFLFTLRLTNTTLQCEPAYTCHHRHLHKTKEKSTILTHIRYQLPTKQATWFEMGKNYSALIQRRPYANISSFTAAVIVAVEHQWIIIVTKLIQPVHLVVSFVCVWIYNPK